MKDSVKHSRIMIGVLLLVVAGLMAYMSFSSPKVYVTPDSSTVPHSDYDDYNVPSSDNAGVVNINLATVDDLTRVDGIGEDIATNIVGYREENGEYSSVNDLLKVRGIGESKLGHISPYLTV